MLVCPPGFLARLSSWGLVFRVLHRSWKVKKFGRRGDVPIDVLDFQSRYGRSLRHFVLYLLEWI
jgi:hypothetical protein